MTTLRLTMAQALVRYLTAQRTEFNDRIEPMFAGVWAIFGHGNVAALGEALWQSCEAQRIALEHHGDVALFGRKVGHVATEATHPAGHHLLNAGSCAQERCLAAPG